MSGVETTFRLMTQRSVLIGVTISLWAGSMTSLPWALNFLGLCLSIVMAGYAVVFSILLRTVLSGERNASRRRVALDRWVFARLFLAYPAYRFLLAVINVGLSFYYFDACFPGALFAPHEVAVNAATYLWFVLEHLSSTILQLAGSQTGLPEAWRAPLKISTSSQVAGFAFVAMNLSAITPIAHLVTTWIVALADAFRHGGTVEEDTALGIADLEDREEPVIVRPMRRIQPYSDDLLMQSSRWSGSPGVSGLLMLVLIALLLIGASYLFASSPAYMEWLASRGGWILRSVGVAVAVLLVAAALAVVTDSPEDNVP